MRSIGLLTLSSLLLALGRFAPCAPVAPAAVPQFSVHEIVFRGPAAAAADCPARDVELTTVWRHETGGAEVRIRGFWDGDGKGGAVGDVYKVRFCPPKPGAWTLARTISNREELRGQPVGSLRRAWARPTL